MRDPDLTILSKLRKPKSKVRNLVGRQFGKLTPYGFLGIDSHNDARWLCRCDCGNFTIVAAVKLLAGTTISCACFRKTRLGKETRTHGQTKTLVYRRWGDMNSRCINPKVQSYKYYGAIGIKVCQGFRDFPTFSRIIGEMPTPKHSTDRINTLGNYSCGECPECLSNEWPMNVRWATATEQAQNTRTNIFLTANGETRCIAEWARIINVPAHVIQKRHHRGWSDTQALGFKEHTRGSVFLTLNGETHTQREWAKKLGFKKSTIQTRLKRGWPVERALTTAKE